MLWHMPSSAEASAVARGSWVTELERHSSGDIVYELTIFIELRRGYFVASGSTYRRRRLV